MATSQGSLVDLSAPVKKRCYRFTNLCQNISTHAVSATLVHYVTHERNIDK